MAMSIIDPGDFLFQNMFKEEYFVNLVNNFDWTQFKDKNVLIKGCKSTVIPQWAFMVFTARLSTSAKSIRFGNEHSNIVVYRKTKTH
jgi:hypothetical protein